MMRILLADDQAKVRSAIRLLLEQDEALEVLGEAADATGLLDWVSMVCPDAILLDWELPGGDAPELLSVIRESCSRVKVIALSGLPEARQAALDAGADAFVSKGDPPEHLLKAIDSYRQRKAVS
jgi:DNA-binding NarL/FixJ family response regulator